MQKKLLHYETIKHTILENDDVDPFFTQVEFIIVVTSPNSSISSYHFINGSNIVDGEHYV